MQIKRVLFCCNIAISCLFTHRLNKLYTTDNQIVYSLKVKYISFRNQQYIVYKSVIYSSFSNHFDKQKQTHIIHKYKDVTNRKSNIYCKGRRNTSKSHHQNKFNSTQYNK